MSAENWQAWLRGLDWQNVDSAGFDKLPKSERLRRIRHSTSHVMASALRRRDDRIQFATGPATQQGFFYDVVPSEPVTRDDFGVIEEEMSQIVRDDSPFQFVEVPKPQAERYFADIGQSFKTEILKRIEGDTVTLYRHAEFVDLCAGPHVPSTGRCGHFKLLNVSAAHWGEEEQPSLTRLTGAAWWDAKSLRLHLQFLEAAKARDHRTLGPQLGLFSFHPWAASALWHPAGLVIRNQLLALWRQVIEASGYIEILNPLLYRKELFETSGHWQHFQADMFVFRDAEGEPDFILKPMNCPDTMLFFGTQTRSYRDLPLRVAEGQVLHRNEATGAIHGIMRTRNFVQDDAHIFLAPDQLQDEIRGLMNMLDQIYGIFGLEYHVMLSTRPESYMGEIEVWNRAEQDLRGVLENSGMDFTIDEGGGSFYGPKIDVAIKDSLGRDWQCGTFQLDFQLPQRFNLKYTAQDGNQHCPIVIHRAIFGSLERFIGVLVEHFGGAFPTWLAPVQAVVLPIGLDHLEYAEKVCTFLKSHGIRSEIRADESVNYRIRASETSKVPYILVVGTREAEAGTVSVRRHRQKHQRVLSLDDLAAELETSIGARSLDVEVSRIRSPLEISEAVSTEDENY